LTVGNIFMIFFWKWQILFLWIAHVVI
jgi:hypothetical protein